VAGSGWAAVWSVGVPVLNGARAAIDLDGFWNRGDVACVGDIAVIGSLAPP